MNARAKKIISLAIIAALLFGSGALQNNLNRDRDTLGLTFSAPLQDAPPLLALTTQVLGGFRGLISNYLWSRANDLQLNGQFFEAAQLANWITDLEPHYDQVWIYQSWNMAWNISVKCKDFSDRWRWVNNGIELLRDRGLRYNPDSILIYQQLGWTFQNKMGVYLDDANAYYKTEWAREMTPFFGPHGTNLDGLINPKTAQERANALELREKYKIDPVFAKKVNDEWGPLDWRTPEPHAIYWYSYGLAQAKKHPDKVSAGDLIRLQRGVFQSMMQGFQHGQVIDNPFTTNIELGPNLEIISNVNKAYEDFMRSDTNEAQNIAIAHRNFLLDAVYYLYEDNRIAEAQKWYDYLAQKYPDKAILTGHPDTLPKNLTLDQYAVARVQEDVTETSPDAITAAVEGLLIQAYVNLAIGQDDRYAGFGRLARKTYDVYTAKIEKFKPDIARIGLPPFDIINRTVLRNLLDPQDGLPLAAREVIRSQLKIPGSVNQPYGVISTNSTQASVLSWTTNSPPTVSQ